MQILIDRTYDPKGKEITSSTKLGPGISMARFLGARGSRTQLQKLYNAGFNAPPDFQQIARNLLVHAQIIQSITGIQEFAQHRLIVSEGIYEPNPKFEISEQKAGSAEQAKALAKKTDGATWGKGKKGYVVRTPQYVGERPSGVLELRRTGRAVVYQLVDRKGNTDPRKTFDLAVYWKDYINYDKLTLDYDTYDPSGELTCQIVIEIPDIPESFNVNFGYSICTKYNGALQATNELLEILPDDDV